MDFKEIEKFIDLAKKKSLQELSYKDEKLSLKVSFSTSEKVVTYAPTDRVESSKKIEKKSKVVTGTYAVKAPLVGTFYNASAPGEAPFVKVGDHVSAGTTLCIVEAMKIMNEIEAEYAGVVKEILIKNEDFVEYAQELFIIEKDS